MAKKIGFKFGNLGDWGNWGSNGSSVSKWEDSYFGGFHKLITDYPRVIIDTDVDFDFAPIKHLTYYEKEKILKIFLSKVKYHGDISFLIRNSKTETESSFIYGKTIITTIDRNDKIAVIDHLIGADKEYSPLFKHYRDFIIDSDISFKKPLEKSGRCESKNDDDKNNNSDGGKNRSDSSGKPKDSKECEDKKENELNGNSGQNKNGKNSVGSKPSQENVFKNKEAFNKALGDIKEEEYNFNKLSTFDKKTRTEIQQIKNTETNYTQHEKDVADNLTKLLDISFDPTSDTVKNLRLGKLDITKIAEVPAGNIAIYKQEIENQTTKPFSVVILCDESYSMERYGRKLPQYNIVKSLYLSFSDILPQDKIFVYGHSGSQTPELYVYQDSYNPNFMFTIDRMIYRGFQENYDGPIIEEVYKSVRAATNDRIIFIVLSDGEPLGYGYGGSGDISNMKQIIEKCKRDEFVTVGIGIQAHHVKDLYQYSTVVDDLSDMPKKVSYILNHVVKTEFQ